MKYVSRGVLATLVLSGVVQAATQFSGEDENSPKPIKSFLMAICMIGVSEIGDKTFLIAALMAMRHTRWAVFSSAASSLALMTILSGVAGHTFVTFIPESYTKFFAGVLFIVFGYKLTKEGLAMAKDAGVEEELAEVEEELSARDINKKNEGLESGGNQLKISKFDRICNKIYEVALTTFSPIWIQIFVMNFLAEFGDRSQISIIAMASDSNYWFTIFGGVIGHFICTGFAVIGGKLLATKISMRTVTLGGAISFYIFGLLYIREAMQMSE